MKSKILLISILLCGIFVNAQKIDLDAVNIKNKARRLPKIVLDPSYTTFSTEFIKMPSVKQYSSETPVNQLKVQGKKYVPSNGSLNLIITFGDFIVEGNKITERVEEIRDKNNQVVNRIFYYAAHVDYNIEIKGKVVDSKGTILNEYFLTRKMTIPKFWNSPDYKARNEAVSYINNNKTVILTNIVEGEIKSAISTFNNLLSYDFAYEAIVINRVLWELDSKKSEEFEPYNAAIDLLKTNILSIKHEEIPANIDELTKSAIDYFTNLPAKYSDPKEKNHKKLRYGAYYNLAIYYWATGKFEKAKEYAQKIVENDYDPKDGTKIINEIEELVPLLAKHNLANFNFYTKAELEN